LSRQEEAVVAGPVRAADVEMLGEAGMTYRVLIKTENVKVQEVFFEAGKVSKGHAHPEDQAGFIVAGSFEVTLDGEAYVLGPKDAYSIPGGVVHAIRSIEGGSYVLFSALSTGPKESAESAEPAAHSHDSHPHSH